MLTSRISSRGLTTRHNSKTLTRPLRNRWWSQIQQFTRKSWPTKSVKKRSTSRNVTDGFSMRNWSRTIPRWEEKENWGSDWWWAEVWLSLTFLGESRSLRRRKREKRWLSFFLSVRLFSCSSPKPLRCCAFWFIYFILTLHPPSRRKCGKQTFVVRGRVICINLNGPMCCV